MPKVGLKDTLALIAKGYSKKEIDALAAIDEEQEKTPEVPAPVITDSAPAPEEPKEPEIDYKALYEEQLKKTKEAEEKTKKIQQGNVHSDSAPALEEKRKEQAESLNNLVRSFM